MSSDVFERNLDLLRRRDPELADRIRSVAIQRDRVTLLKSRSGDPTLRLSLGDGRTALIHSEYDPRREASQIVGSRKWEASCAYLFNGLGLGYMALSALPRLDAGRWIACVEADEQLFRMALESVDLSPLLERPRLGFFVGSDRVRFRAWLAEFLNTSGVLNLHVADFPPCVRLFPEFYDAVAAEVGISVRRRAESLSALIQRGRSIERNAIRNLIHLRTAMGIEGLGRLLEGTPAIIVGAGPSLTSALSHLRALEGRAAVIASDAALKVLLAAGIPPEFVVSVDMNESVLKCYEGVNIPEYTALVFHPDCHFEVPSRFPGRKMSFDTESRFSRWCRSFMGSRGSLPEGGSVAHTGLLFADALGADPLVLVGIDLSFPKEQTHADGVAVGGAIDRNDPRLVSVRGVHGEPVLTTPGFQGFIRRFEETIARISKTVVQTSTIGAAIRGAEDVPLSAALKRFPAGRGQFERVAPALEVDPPEFNLNAFDSETTRVLEELGRIESASEEGLGRIRKLERPEPSDRRTRNEDRNELARCQALEKEIFSLTKAVELLDRLVAGAARETVKLRESMAALKSDDPERIRLRVRQFEVLFACFKENAAFFASELKGVRERILKGEE